MTDDTKTELNCPVVVVPPRVELALLLGAEIRRRRKNLNLSQRQLANRIGWPREAIAKLEGKTPHTPSILSLHLIANALNTSMGSIVGVLD